MADDIPGEDLAGDPVHATPPGVDDATVDALGKLSRD